MNVSPPHFQLFSHSTATRPAAYAGADDSSGKWRFVLKREDGRTEVEADDEEPGTPADRLELLAIVRGLEALDQPSRVTLFTESRYVSRGLRFGLESWRENDWQWERFGQMMPVKNSDLWQRIDQAMRYHEVDVRSSRYDATDDLSFTCRDLAERDEQTAGFREVLAAPSASAPLRRMRVKGRELRMDVPPPQLSFEGRPRRGQPPDGFFTRAAAALFRFFRR